MIFLLLSHAVGRPKDMKNVGLIIIGFLAINIVTFLQASRGLYLVFGAHTDMGKVHDFSADEETINEIEKEYEPTEKEKAEFSAEKLLSIQTTRIETLKKLRESLEVRKNIILRRSKVFEGHLTKHSFFDFKPSEGYECLPTNQKIVIWIFIVLGMILSAPFWLVLAGIAIGIALSPILLVVLFCCSKNRQNNPHARAVPVEPNREDMVPGFGIEIQPLGLMNMLRRRRNRPGFDED